MKKLILSTLCGLSLFCSAQDFSEIQNMEHNANIEIVNIEVENIRLTKEYDSIQNAIRTLESTCTSKGQSVRDNKKLIRLKEKNKDEIIQSYLKVKLNIEIKKLYELYDTSSNKQSDLYVSQYKKCCYVIYKMAHFFPIASDYDLPGYNRHGSPTGDILHLGVVPKRLNPLLELLPEKNTLNELGGISTFK